jgi:hypothetical protein
VFLRALTTQTLPIESMDPRLLTQETIVPNAKIVVVVSIDIYYPTQKRVISCGIIAM